MRAHRVAEGTRQSEKESHEALMIPVADDGRDGAERHNLPTAARRGLPEGESNRADLISAFRVRSSAFDQPASLYPTQLKTGAFGPEGRRKLAGGEASPRAETTGSRSNQRCAPDGAMETPPGLPVPHPGHVPIADTIRWLRSFPRKRAYSPHAASSLHHRLISFKPPAWKQTAVPLRLVSHRRLHDSP